MMTLYEWREMRKERSRRRTVRRLTRYTRLTETERKLQVLETFKDWGVITEEEYLQRKAELVPRYMSARTSG